MAFSLVLADMHLSTAQLASSSAGFNLGIEAMQLLLVLLCTAALSALWTGILHRRGRGVTREGHEADPPRTPVLTPRGVNEASQRSG
jgi:hypothetical protein